MKLQTTVLAFSIGIVVSLHAQKPTETISLRVLATGQPPTTEIEVRGNEGSVEKEVDPDLLPPRELFVKDGNEYHSLRISLGVLSRAESCKRIGKGITLYQQAGGTPQKPAYRAWAQVTVPPAATSGTLLMHQAPKQNDWKKPVLKFLPDDEQIFPNGSIRIVNTSALTIQATLGKEKATLSPGATTVVKGLSTDEPVRYAISAKVKGKGMKIANSALPLDSRATLAIVPQSKANSKRPVRVSVFRDE